jgi:hypothetical protein
MRSDHEIERLLEEWLEDEARPIPHEVLENTLESVAKTPQARPRPSGLGWLRNGAPGIAAAAAGLFLLVAGLLAVDRLGFLGAAPPSPTPGPLLVWDAGAAIRANPDRNPAPDAFGNPGVWSYRSSSTLHAPYAYQLLGSFVNDAWGDARFAGLAVSADPRGIVLNPFGDVSVGWRYVILGWRSPIAGEIAVRGVADLIQRPCPEPASGVRLMVDLESETLAEVQVDPAQSETVTTTVTVSRGESIFFIVDPGADSRCDNTLLTLTITGADGTTPESTP